MTKAAIKRILAATVGTLLLRLTLGVESAQAFGLTYDFTVNIDSTFCADGNPAQLSQPCRTYIDAGTTYQGQFSYDDATLTGKDFEDLTPGSGNLAAYDPQLALKVTQGSLELLFDFLGRTYTEQDDFDYQDSRFVLSYPRIRFSNGTLLGLDFLVPPAKSGIGFRISRFQAEPSLVRDDFFVYVMGGDGSIDTSGVRVGSVTYTATAAVPEPSGIAGVLVAGGFIGLRLWKRHSHR